MEHSLMVWIYISFYISDELVDFKANVKKTQKVFSKLHCITAEVFKAHITKSPFRSATKNIIHNYLINVQSKIKICVNRILYDFMFTLARIQYYTKLKNNFMK